MLEQQEVDRTILVGGDMGSRGDGWSAPCEASIPRSWSSKDEEETQLLAWRPASSSVRPRVVGELRPGSLLGGFRILERVGSGGMGDVYAAVDRRLGRRVAIKVLAAGWLERGTPGTRFCRETRAMAAINHPNVVTLYSVEKIGDRRFLVMEWVDGATLGDSGLCAATLEIDRFLEIVMPLIEALGAVHQQGIAHRDLKPGNVMIDLRGRVKLLDFGLAGWRETSEEDAIDPERTSLLPLTRAGELLGTPSYMSPEQLRGRPIDARSDVFSAGVLFFEMLTGEKPFRGATSTEIAASILRDPPPSLSRLRSAVPRDLQRVLQRCLHKEPERRFADAGALLEALKALQSRRQARRKSTSSRLDRQRLARLAERALVSAAAALGPFASTLR